MTEQLLQLIEHYGLIIVFCNVLLDQIGLPVPAVPTLVVAGAVAAQGKLPFTELFLVSVAACLLADSAWYQLGRLYGIRVLKTLCRISLEPDTCVSDTQTRMERWGINSLIIAKFVPGLAIIAPPLAGAMRIGWRRFIALSTLGAALWVGTGLLVGALFQAQIGRILSRIEAYSGTAGIVILAGLAAYVAFKWWQRRRFFVALRMARISVADLYDLIQAGAAPTIVDVRSSTARALDPRWIPGALHIPLENVQKHVQTLPRDHDIILYCTCPSEASAARVAKLLMKQGFKKVRPLHGGLDAWAAAGYAVLGATTTPASRED